MPTALVPLEEPAGREERLLALTRWVVVPEPTWGERLGVSLVAFAGSAALLAVVLGGPQWQASPPPGLGKVRVASVLPTDLDVLPTSVARWQ